MRKFNPCSPCCETPNNCRVGYYPAYGPTETTDLESNFYYSLNVPFGEEVYNPITEETFTALHDPYEYDILIWTSFEVCVFHSPQYGYDEFVTFLERGKCILLATEHSACLGGAGYTKTQAFLSAIGSSMSVDLDLVHVGCQIVANYSALNTINWNLNAFPVGGSSLCNIGSGWSIVENIGGQVLVSAEDCNGGKVVLMGDNNMLTCGGQSYWSILYRNICRNEGIPIAVYEEEDE